jgi:hypothetical protein
MNTPQPLNWPFPPLDPIQRRNQQLAHAAAVREAQRQQQQKLRECLEALGEALL